MNTLHRLGALLHGEHRLRVQVGGLDGIHLMQRKSSSAPRFSWAEAKHAPEPTVSTEFLRSGPALPRKPSSAEVRRVPLRYQDQHPSSDSTMAHLQLLLVVAFALAFRTSSSIFRWRCSSRFSSVSNCCRIPTIESRACCLGSGRRPNQPHMIANSQRMNGSIKDSSQCTERPTFG